MYSVTVKKKKVGFTGWSSVEITLPLLTVFYSHLMKSIYLTPLSSGSPVPRALTSRHYQALPQCLWLPTSPKRIMGTIPVWPPIDWVSRMPAFSSTVSTDTNAFCYGSWFKIQNGHIFCDYASSHMLTAVVFHTPQIEHAVLLWGFSSPSACELSNHCQSEWLHLKSNFPFNLWERQALLSIRFYNFHCRKWMIEC